MAGPGKTIVIIKRASVAALPVEAVPSHDNPRHLNATRSQPLSGLTWRSKLGAPFRFFHQRRWESAPAVSVAIVAGLAVAGLATTLVQTVMFTAPLPTQPPGSVGSTRFQPTPEPVVSLQGSVEGHVPDATHSSAPSMGRDSELSEPAFASPAIPVVPRRASIRTVRPKFPDAFRGEVLVHEEPVAPPTKSPEPSERIFDLQTPADAGQRQRIGEEQEQAVGPAQETAPSIVESMFEPSRTADSD